MAFSGKLTAANADVLAKIAQLSSPAIRRAGAATGPSRATTPSNGAGHGLSEYKPFRDRRGL